MKTIKLTATFNAPIEDVWEALTNSELIEKWTGSSAKFDCSVGGKFSLWDCDIHGTNTKIEKSKTLEEDWYSDSTSDTKYHVSFFLSNKDGVTILKLTHSSVADNEYDDFVDGWKDYYFEPIKQLLET